jgi:hypothetical protein
MRARAENDGISVHAIAGTRVVCLGMDATRKAARGLLGFAIERREGRKKPVWLKGLRYFEAAPPENPAAGMPVPSDQGPIQGFLWGDYGASLTQLSNRNRLLSKVSQRKRPKCPATYP